MTESKDQQQPQALQQPMARRTVLAWSGAAAVAALSAASRAPAADASASDSARNSTSTTTSAPATSLDASGVELFMKLHASTADGDMVPWYYTGRIYAIRERQAPVHLFNLEGTEIYWVKRVGKDEWRTTSSTLTFYRDARSGEYLESYTNPFNGRTQALYPNVLRSRPGTFQTFSPRGQEGIGALVPWQVEVYRNGGVLWLTTHRASLDMPQPWIETQTMFGNAAEADDPRVTRPPTTFTSSYSAPYLKWMEMGDLPGHLLWHSSGRKLASLAELPAGYKARADRLQPGHFIAPK